MIRSIFSIYLLCNFTHIGNKMNEFFNFQCKFRWNFSTFLFLSIFLSFLSLFNFFFISSLHPWAKNRLTNLDNIVFVVFLFKLVTIVPLVLRFVWKFFAKIGFSTIEICKIAHFARYRSDLFDLFIFTSNPILQLFPIDLQLDTSLYVVGIEFVLVCDDTFCSLWENSMKFRITSSSPRLVCLLYQLLYF